VFISLWSTRRPSNLRAVVQASTGRSPAAEFETAALVGHDRARHRIRLIQETARHAGHADIVRESLDGATAFSLMAAAEGWPATPWLQPWSPGGD
jgi:hypothetical protein